jgi:hypothetical protein
VARQSNVLRPPNFPLSQGAAARSAWVTLKGIESRHPTPLARREPKGDAYHHGGVPVVECSLLVALVPALPGAFEVNGNSR